MLITSDEVTAYMGGVSLNAEETTVLETVIIPGVQEELELFLNRPVEPVQVRESLLVDEYGFITLTVSPAWKIIKVMQSDGSVIPGNPYIPPVMSPDPLAARSVDYSGLGQTPLPYRYNIGSFGLSAAPWWGYNVVGSAYIVVEYIAGYKGYTDNALKLAITRVVAREVERQFDKSASLVGGAIQEVQDSDPRRKGWMPEELERFRRIRRRVIR